MEQFENPFSKKNKEDREKRIKDTLYVKQDMKEVMRKAIDKQEAAMKKQIEEFESMAERLKTRVLPYSHIENLNKGFEIILAQTIAMFNSNPNLFLDEDKDLIMASVTNIKGIISMIEHKYTEPKQLIDTVSNNFVKEKSNIIKFPKEIIPKDDFTTLYVDIEEFKKYFEKQGNQKIPISNMIEFFSKESKIDYIREECKNKFDECGFYDCWGFYASMQEIIDSALFDPTKSSYMCIERQVLYDEVVENLKVEGKDISYLRNYYQN